SIVFIVGRNSLWLGSALIICRWPLFILGIWFFYRLSKRNVNFMWKLILLISLTALPLEEAYNLILQERIKKTNGEEHMSVMTYNLLFVNKWPLAITNNIKQNNPDILAVQELTPRWKKILAREIGSAYKYSNTLPLNGAYGIGIYSKHPITNVSFLETNNGRPYAQVATINKGSKEIQFINTHLTSPAIAVGNPNRFTELFAANYRMREQQVKEINHLAKRDSNFDVQILTGDLNTTRFEPLYRKIRRHWVDIYRRKGKGRGVNFPNTDKRKPIITLDYIMARGKVQVEETRVIQGGSSDHLAVFGKIKL
ncbi:MAG: endonuclease/exonuclease/phosphatase family protein, partial [Bacteroidales bacterium]|nr:endonuclease/exonuclease/phosphatase family protein [Bacteroidales bacterium]